MSAGPFKFAPLNGCDSIFVHVMIAHLLIAR